MRPEDWITAKLADLRDSRLGTGGILLAEHQHILADGSVVGTLLIGCSEADFIDIFGAAIQASASGTGTAFRNALLNADKRTVLDPSDPGGTATMEVNLGYAPYIQQWIQDGRF